MYQLSANIELLFTEAGPDAGDRVRAAAAAGFDAVEMWFSTDKDLDSLAKALADTGVQLTSLLAGPRMTYTYPGTDLAPFHQGLDLAVEHARQLGCPRIVLASGMGFPGMNRQKNHSSHRHVRRGARAAPRLGRRLHPRAGQLAGRPPRCAHRPHRGRRGHRPGHELRAVRHPLRPVPLDRPGRGPGDGAGQRGGPGEVRAARRRTRPARAWQRRRRLARAAGRVRASGYDGPIGLEYFPAVESAASTEYIRSVAADA